MTVRRCIIRTRRLSAHLVHNLGRCRFAVVGHGDHLEAIRAGISTAEFLQRLSVKCIAKSFAKTSAHVGVQGDNLVTYHFSMRYESFKVDDNARNQMRRWFDHKHP